MICGPTRENTRTASVGSSGTRPDERPGNGAFSPTRGLFPAYHERGTPRRYTAGRGPSPPPHPPATRRPGVRVSPLRPGRPVSPLGWVGPVAGRLAGAAPGPLPRIPLLSNPLIVSIESYIVWSGDRKGPSLQRPRLLGTEETEGPESPPRGKGVLRPFCVPARRGWATRTFRWRAALSRLSPRRGLRRGWGGCGARAGRPGRAPRRRTPRGRWPRTGCPARGRPRG